MKKYLKHFMVFFIVIAVLLVVFVALKIVDGKTSVSYERTNSTCLTDERVFDYADKLTEIEEEALRDLIAEKEKQCGSDIVLVTLDDATVDSDNAMMNYADDFYDNAQFGYNAAWGDGAIYVDNWANGYVWFSTSGRVEDRYSSAMIDSLITSVCDSVNSDPYGAYTKYVNSVSNTMSGKIGAQIPVSMIFFVALLVSGVYLIVGLVGNKGKKTTNEKTYVVGGAPNFKDNRDIFVTKHTTSRHIETSSGGSGGGGGHHMSSGGHSHGGGGGRH